MEDFLWEVKYYFNKLIKSPIRNVFEGIKNIFKWMPLVWKDRDWDYVFLLYVMEFKLKNTSKCLKNSTWPSVNVDKYTKTLDISAHLIHRLIEDNYNETQLEKFYDIDHLFETEYPIEDKYKGFKTQIKNRAALREYDKEMFGRMFKKHLDSWWD